MRIAIVGAGVLGLAHAYAYAKRGHSVRVYERSRHAHGASIRNFGLIWPIGQPAGTMAELADRSRRIWIEILDDARIPYSKTGSLHLAHHQDEETVIHEFIQREPNRGRWITPAQAQALSPAVLANGLRGALFSDSEMMIDPRRVIAGLPAYLTERFNVQFQFGVAVLESPVSDADMTVICSGDDFESLYPDILAASGLTRCKLQMMRTYPQPSDWKLGPALAAGLTLRFYSSFRQCESISALTARLGETMTEYEAWRIHVMASQMSDGSITIGDSHEYGLAVDIFNKDRIDQLILAYLATFAQFPASAIAQRWNGVYAKHPDRPYCVFEPEKMVRIVTGLGGAGMTLSMGLAEDLCNL